MNIRVDLADDDVERIAGRVVELLAHHPTGANPGWLDVTGASAHLAVTEHAVRWLVKRQRRIPFHRTSNGRLRFSLAELDRWVRTGSCEPTHEDLP